MGKIFDVVEAKKLRRPSDAYWSIEWLDIQLDSFVQVDEGFSRAELI